MTQDAGLPPWLSAALHRDIKTDDAIDMIFDKIDRILTEGNFAEVDDLLTRLVPLCEALTSDILVALLTITKAAAPKLTKREKFFETVREALKSESDLDKLLKGLD